MLDKVKSGTAARIAPPAYAAPGAPAAVARALEVEPAAGGERLGGDRHFGGERQRGRRDVERASREVVGEAAALRGDGDDVRPRLEAEEPQAPAPLHSRAALAYGVRAAVAERRAQVLRAGAVFSARF